MSKHFHLPQLTKHRDIRPALQEEHIGHYRQWKKGKSWVYSAGMLTILLGGVVMDTALGLEQAVVVYAANVNTYASLRTSIIGLVSDNNTFKALNSYTTMVNAKPNNGQKAALKSSIISFLRDVSSRAISGKAKNDLDSAITAFQNNDSGNAETTSITNIISSLTTVVSELSQISSLQTDITNLSASYVANEIYTGTQTLGQAVSSLQSQYAAIDGTTYTAANEAYASLNEEITSAISERDTAYGQLNQLLSATYTIDVKTVDGYTAVKGDFDAAKTLGTTVTTQQLKDDYIAFSAAITMAENVATLKTNIAKLTSSYVGSELAATSSTTNQTIDAVVGGLKDTVVTSDNYNTQLTTYNNVLTDISNAEKARSAEWTKLQDLFTTAQGLGIDTTSYNYLSTWNTSSVLTSTLTSAYTELSGKISDAQRNNALEAKIDALPDPGLVGNEAFNGGTYGETLGATVSALKDLEITNDIYPTVSSLYDQLSGANGAIATATSTRKTAMGKVTVALNNYSSATDAVKKATAVVDAYSPLSGYGSGDIGTYKSKELEGYADALNYAISLEAAKQEALANHGGYVANEPTVIAYYTNTFAPAIAAATTTAEVATTVTNFTNSEALTSARAARDNALDVASSLLSVSDTLDKTTLTAAINATPSSNNPTVTADSNTTAYLISAINAYKATQKGSLTVPDASYVANEPSSIAQGAAKIGSVVSGIGTSLGGFNGTGIDPFDFVTVSGQITAINKTISDAKTARTNAMNIAAGYVGEGKIEPTYFAEGSAADQAFEALQTAYGNTASSGTVTVDDAYTTANLNSKISAYESAFLTSAKAQANALIAANGGYVGNEMDVINALNTLRTANGEGATGLSLDAAINTYKVILKGAEDTRDAYLTSAASVLGQGILSDVDDSLQASHPVKDAYDALDTAYKVMAEDEANKTLSDNASTSKGLSDLVVAYMKAVNTARLGNLQTAIETATKLTMQYDYLSSDDQPGMPGMPPYATAVSDLQSAITTASSQGGSTLAKTSNLNEAIGEFNTAIAPLKEARDTAVTNANNELKAASSYTGNTELTNLVTQLQQLVNAAYTKVDFDGDGQQVARYATTQEIVDKTVAVTTQTGLLGQLSTAISDAEAAIADSRNVANEPNFDDIADPLLSEVATAKGNLGHEAIQASIDALKGTKTTNGLIANFNTKVADLQKERSDALSTANGLYTQGIPSNVRDIQTVKDAYGALKSAIAGATYTENQTAPCTVTTAGLNSAITTYTTARDTAQQSALDTAVTAARADIAKANYVINERGVQTAINTLQGLIDVALGNTSLTPQSFGGSAFSRGVTTEAITSTLNPEDLSTATIDLENGIAAFGTTVNPIEAARDKALTDAKDKIDAEIPTDVKDNSAVKAAFANLQTVYANTPQSGTTGILAANKNTTDALNDAVGVYQKAIIQARRDNLITAIADARAAMVVSVSNETGFNQYADILNAAITTAQGVYDKNKNGNAPKKGEACRDATTALNDAVDTFKSNISGMVSARASAIKSAKDLLEKVPTYSSEVQEAVKVALADLTNKVAGAEKVDGQDRATTGDVTDATTKLSQELELFKDIDDAIESANTTLENVPARIKNEADYKTAESTLKGVMLTATTALTDGDAKLADGIDTIASDLNTAVNNFNEVVSNLNASRQDAIDSAKKVIKEAKTSRVANETAVKDAINALQAEIAKAQPKDGAIGTITTQGLYDAIGDFNGSFNDQRGARTAAIQLAKSTIKEAQASRVANEDAVKAAIETLQAKIASAQIKGGADGAITTQGLYDAIGNFNGTFNDQRDTRKAAIQSAKSIIKEAQASRVANEAAVKSAIETLQSKIASAQIKGGADGAITTQDLYDAIGNFDGVMMSQREARKLALKNAQAAIEQVSETNISNEPDTQATIESLKDAMAAGRIKGENSSVNGTQALNDATGNFNGAIDTVQAQRTSALNTAQSLIDKGIPTNLSDDTDVSNALSEMVAAGADSKEAKATTADINAKIDAFNKAITTAQTALAAAKSDAQKAIDGVPSALAKEPAVTEAIKDLQALINDGSATKTDINAATSDFNDVVAKAAAARQQAIDDANKVLANIPDNVRDAISDQIDNLNKVLSDAASGNASTADIQDATVTLSQAMVAAVIALEDQAENVTPATPSGPATPAETGTATTPTTVASINAAVAPTATTVGTTTTATPTTPATQATTEAPTTTEAPATPEASANDETTPVLPDTETSAESVTLPATNTKAKQGFNYAWLLLAPAALLAYLAFVQFKKMNEDTQEGEA